MTARVQELCESRGGRPGLPVLMSLMVSVDLSNIEPCLRIGHSLSLIRQPDIRGLTPLLDSVGIIIIN